MELKYSIALYACAIVAVIYLVFSFVTFRKKRKYKGGSKTVEAEYLKEIPYYKQRLAIYKALKFLLTAMIIVSLLLSGFLMARPYETKITETHNVNRDIILCMDISTSVDQLNANLVEKLQETVEQLNGERFGIVIFNTSPVLLCPLTDDYQYIISILDTVNEALELRVDYYNGTASYSNRLVELDAYISNGTLIGNEERGSSLIGDGLAGAALSFPDVEERPDRSRIIIFTSDNDANGTELYDLPEAGQLCQEKGIIVYGIGTDVMYSSDEAEMRSTVRATGGEFYYGESSRTVSNIVEQIQAQIATDDNIQREITEVDKPELPFILLLVSVASMIMLAAISKV